MNGHSEPSRKFEISEYKVTFFKHSTDVLIVKPGLFGIFGEILMTNK